MLQTAVFGMFIVALGWTMNDLLRQDIRPRDTLPGLTPAVQTPANVLSLEAYRERNQRRGRPADAPEQTDADSLKEARAAIDLRMRDIMEADHNVA